MKPLDDILAAARAQPKRIVLSEGEDPRIAEAAAKAQKDGIAHPILIGKQSVIAERLSEIGESATDFEIIDPATAPQLRTYADAYYALRQHKGVTPEAAIEAMQSPLGFAAMMVRQGDADGTVGGALHTTADTVRAALQIIGRRSGVKTVSSFFLIMLCEPHHTKKGGFVFADCGLVVEPTVEELAEIAISSAQSFNNLLGEEPRVAMLSFSTHGSAQHDRVNHVAEAAKRAKNAQADLIIDGDVQFDAAFVPAVSKAKSPDSPLKGEANVLIFPNLEAGNIGYKIVERIAGAKAIGPILQGLAKPANDLSRGCSAQDVYSLIAITAVQAAP